MSIALLLGLAAVAVASGGGGGESSGYVFQKAYLQLPDEDPSAEVNELRVPPGWLLGEGQPQANQWAQLAGTLLTATSTALAPVIGPIASQAMSVVSNVIASIKKKTRWVTAANPGRWETIALLNGTPQLRVVLRWGRASFGASGIRVWEGQRNTTGKLPLKSSVSLPNSSDPAWRYVYDGTSKNVASGTRWIQPPGPPMPELYLVVDGGQTELTAWLPARGGDAKDGDYFYRFEITAG